MNQPVIARDIPTRVDPIVTSRLTKFYDRRRVVHALDLRIPRGTVYGFLGRNGSGKSTTIKMLMGLVRPDAGRAELWGCPADELRPEVRARIAYVAEGHPLCRWMSIDESIRFTQAFYPRWNGELADQVLDHFALSRRKKISRLSKGQQAQVSLMLAVATEPELLILDDPTLGLDTVVRKDFLEALIQVIQRRGRTVLFSSHILSEVERLADRIGILVDGVLRADCPTEHFRESVKKVVVDFHGPIPEFPGCSGLVSTRQVGTTLELVLVGFDDGQRQAVEALEPRTIELVDLSLEEAFVEYTRGPRRSLPLLVGENDGQSTMHQGAA